MLTHTTPISELDGIGEAKAKIFNNAGIFTAGDLLTLYPRTYQFRGDTAPVSAIETGDVASVIVTIESNAVERRSSKGIKLVTANAFDDSGCLEIVYFNMPWMTKVLIKGRRMRFYGRVTRTLYGAKMTNPVAEAVFDGAKLYDIMPVYPLSGKLTQNTVFNCARQVLSLCDGIEDVLHPDIITQYGLMHKGEAVRELHLPTSRERLYNARRTLAFEELLVFQLALRRMKDGVAAVPARPLTFKGSGIRLFFDTLPYKLTGAQQRAVKDVLADMCKDTPMMRLLQGDVGSGKTVVASAAIYFAVKNGGQAAMMAPTEILASQHYATLKKQLEPFGLNVALLLGSTKASEKNRIKKELADGKIDVVIGTHSLLQSDVVFDDLVLAVTDEQHRFGVMQRATLVGKSAEPFQAHTLVMSATPIPRTLSLILYGDLDVSVIDEMPPGRHPITTYAYTSAKRRDAYDLIAGEISDGHQAYIICPLVEDDDDGGKRAAEGYADMLSGTVLDGIPTQTVHGRLSPKEKDARMRAFASGEAKILISTTVVEVGVDVPNATVIMIENAECFGLSQLHQLRGRVGRGKSQSYCLLMCDSDSQNASERMRVMCETSDGFKIAEADLLQRGPGDFFGERQSGDISFEFAGASDVELINVTASLAKTIPEGYVTYALEHEIDRFFNKTKGNRMFN